MKKIFSCLRIVVLANTILSAHSENLSANAEANGDALSRAKLAQTRAHIESEFAFKEAACYKAFAVDSCIRQLNTEKRALLAELKRQELSTNDSQRQKNKAEYEQKLSKQKSVNRSVVDTNIPDRATDRSLDLQKKIANAGKRVQETNQKINVSKAKETQRLHKSSLAGQERAKYQNKLREADAHRAALEQKKMVTAKPKASSLPIPE